MYNVIDSVRKLTMQIIVEAYRSYALLAGGGFGGDFHEAPPTGWYYVYNSGTE